jgi:hypothetical protein
MLEGFGEIRLYGVVAAYIKLKQIEDLASAFSRFV